MSKEYILICPFCRNKGYKLVNLPNNIPFRFSARGTAYECEACKRVFLTPKEVKV
jgi:hypothetical protein